MHALDEIGLASALAYHPASVMCRTSHFAIFGYVTEQHDVTTVGGGAAGAICRFGTDPASSVLYVNCKAHEVDNLYVVNTKFFPIIGA